MTDATVLDLMRQMLVLSILLSGPVLAVSLVVGLLISLLQAITQVQDVSLTFVPKIIAIAITFLLLGPWMLQHGVSFTERLYSSIPHLIH